MASGSQRVAGPTLAASRDLDVLARSLAARLGPAAQPTIARFMIACVFACFAEALGVLADAPLAAGLRGRWHADPARLAADLRAAWRADPVLGDAPIVTLTVDELELLAAAVDHDWSHVELSILGTLLERSLAPDERASLGAHFTPRAYIERIVEPTIVEPLRAELSRCAEDIAAQRAFLARLAALRVLDPACGTGNFLYVAMDLLQRLAAEVTQRLRARGVTGELPRIAAARFLGVDRQPRSLAVAELVLWLAELQGWRRDGGPRPLLTRCAGLEPRDAILASDDEHDARDEGGRAIVVTRQGKPGRSAAATPRREHTGARVAAWPDAEFIVSNPPFIGNKRMRELLGAGYVEALRAAHPDVPGDVDYVAYWWHRAALRLRDPADPLRRFGMITTNSVRQRQSGAVLREHLGGGLVLHLACADHPWLDADELPGGAQVRISMTVVRRADEPHALEPRVLTAEPTPRFTRVRAINPDLTTGPDLRAAVPLRANAGLCFQGMNLVGDGFRLSAEQAAELGAHPCVRRYVQGRDLKAGRVERRVIDFFGLDEQTARSASPAHFAHLERSVLPLRARNARDAYARRWWQFGEPRPNLRRALVGLPRYIATPETSRHRFFVLLDADIVPDHQIYAVTSADPWLLGVLSSSAHTLWAARAGGRNGAGNDPRWTSSATFLPFPFPPAHAGRSDIAALASRIEVVRRELVAAGASLTRLYHAVAARSGCDELRGLHARLDAAVLAAYGLPADIDADELLTALLALNHARAAAEARGHVEPLGAGRSG